jgi:cystathionine beta-lyase
MIHAVNRKGTHSVKHEEAHKKFGREDLLPLWVADMDIASPRCVQEALQKRAAHPIYGYTIYPERYYDAIQDWMRKRYGWKIEREWIVPCYGVVPSINFAIEAYTREEDGVIIQSPIYPPFFSSVTRRNRKLLDNTLQYDNGVYRIDFDDLEAKAKEARLLLLCSPHNPTGRAWHKEELEKLIEIALRHDLLIVSDEIHADIVYKEPHHTVGKFEKIAERSVILNAPSKSFNVAGLNTSYAVIPDERLRKQYIEEQNRSGITNGNPFGIEALMAAYEAGEPWLEAVKETLWSNIAYVKSFIQSHAFPIKAVVPEATFLIWLDCRGMRMDQDELVHFFVHEAKLGLNDGLSFGEAGRGFMRLNVATSKEVLEAAMQRLLDAWKERC